MDGTTRIARRVVSTVTDLTKVISGVRTVVVLENDYDDGRLVESDLAFFAQDNFDTVWLVGEYPEEYERGKVVDAPTWIDGLKGARAGIAMKAEARLGSPSYAEGWGPEIGWNDRAKVYGTGERTCVPLGCYEKVLVIREFNPDEAGKSQLKYYAPGVGLVRIGWLGRNDDEREELFLIARTHLGTDALAKARKDALGLDQHAYEVSTEVYGRTSPLEQPAVAAA